jgi:hypothetical protein
MRTVLDIVFVISTDGSGTCGITTVNAVKSRIATTVAFGTNSIIGAVAGTSVYFEYPKIIEYVGRR